MSAYQKCRPTEVSISRGSTVLTILSLETAIPLFCVTGILGAKSTRFLMRERCNALLGLDTDLAKKGYIDFDLSYSRIGTQNLLNMTNKKNPSF